MRGRKRRLPNDFVPPAWISSSEDEQQQPVLVGQQQGVVDLDPEPQQQQHGDDVRQRDHHQLHQEGQHHIRGPRQLPEPQQQPNLGEVDVDQHNPDPPPLHEAQRHEPVDSDEVFLDSEDDDYLQVAAEAEIHEDEEIEGEMEEEQIPIITGEVSSILINIVVFQSVCSV